MVDAMDWLIGCMGALGTAGLVIWGAADLGFRQGREAYRPCEPRVIRGVDNLSPQELRILAKARERMEKVK